MVWYFRDLLCCIWRPRLLGGQSVCAARVCGTDVAGVRLGHTVDLHVGSVVFLEVEGLEEPVGGHLVQGDLWGNYTRAG